MTWPQKRRSPAGKAGLRGNTGKRLSKHAKNSPNRAGFPRTATDLHAVLTTLLQAGNIVVFERWDGPELRYADASWLAGIMADPAVRRVWGAPRIMQPYAARQVLQ